MRAIITVIKRNSTDEEAIAIKKKIKDALKDMPDLEVNLSTVD